jgi:hypothetical protein
MCPVNPYGVHEKGEDDYKHGVGRFSEEAIMINFNVAAIVEEIAKKKTRHTSLTITILPARISIR